MSLAVAQSVCTGNTAAAIATPAFTFGTGPTNGNLMIAVVTMSEEGGLNPVGANGWTCRTFSGGVGAAFYIALFSKYAGASEPAAQTLEVGTTQRHLWSISAWEISGVTGTWATDFVAFTATAAPNPVSSTPLSTSTVTTVDNNELVLLGAVGYCATASATLTSSTGTSDSSHTASGASTDAFGVYDISHAYHYAEPTSGSTVSATLTMSVNNNTNIGYGFVELKASSASTETATVTLAIGNPQFNAGAGRKETSATGLAIGKLQFNAPAQDIKERGAATLAIAAPQIAAFGTDLNVVPKLRQFQIFG